MTMPIGWLAFSKLVGYAAGAALAAAGATAPGSSAGLKVWNDGGFGISVMRVSGHFLQFRVEYAGRG